MKKYLNIFFLIAGTVIILSSCKRYYEEVPLENVTSEYVWDVQDSNGTTALGFLYQTYKYLPGQSAGNGSGQSGYNTLGSNTMLDAATDDAVSSADGTSAFNLANGGLTQFFGFDMNNSWSTDYAAIRRATIFLNNFGVVPLRSADEKRYAFGEARVLRAFFYWELVKRWGGVPLIGDSVFTLEDNVEVPRNTFAECIDYIVSECDRAIDSLRPDPVSPQNIGRWTQAGAMALKAKVLLFAASPLYNGGNIGDALTGYTDYNKDRWKLAADAAKAVMDLNIYKLDPVFNNVFVPVSGALSVETIFASTVNTNQNAEKFNGPPGFGSSALGNGNTSPTQELVDAFGMANGLEISDPNSGYNPLNPYLERDLRFYKTILYNGALWLQQRLQTFIGGASRPGGNNITQTQTGYYCRKAMSDNDTNATSYSSHYGDYIIFRYADILMMYAEAQNEFSGPSPDVLGAVDSIRTRAQLGQYALIDPNISQDSLRTVIRQELRKEFAFEQHRYWDIRRWKIAEEVYKPLHGYDIYKSGPSSFTFNLVTVSTPIFISPKMYLYPIPYNEMISNTNMVQNPGW